MEHLIWSPPITRDMSLVETHRYPALGTITHFSILFTDRLLNFTFGIHQYFLNCILPATQSEPHSEILSEPQPETQSATQSEPPPETQSETIGGRACGPGGSTTPPGWI